MLFLKEKMVSAQLTNLDNTIINIYTLWWRFFHCLIIWKQKFYQSFLLDQTVRLPRSSCEKTCGTFWGNRSSEIYWVTWPCNGLQTRTWSWLAGSQWSECVFAQSFDALKRLHSWAQYSRLQGKTHGWLFSSSLLIKKCLNDRKTSSTRKRMMFG